MAVTQRDVRIGGVITDLLACGETLPPPSSKCILIVPGNPGVAQFYPYFMTVLHQETQLPVYCISLAGHDLGACNGSHVYSCSDQVKHKVATFEFLQGLGYGDIVVLAHSVGSFFCMDAMLQRPELPVSRLVCLFPFIRQDLSPFQHFAHRTLFLLQPAAVVLARVLSWLPSRLRRGVIFATTASQYGTSFVPTIDAMLNPYTMHNSLALGEEEFNIVPKTFNTQLLEELGRAGKLAMVYTTNDIWATEGQYEELRATVPSLPLTFLETECSHAFCVFPRQCDVLVNAVLPYITATTPGCDGAVASSSSCRRAPCSAQVAADSRCNTRGCTATDKTAAARPRASVEGADRHASRTCLAGGTPRGVYRVATAATPPLRLGTSSVDAVSPATSADATTVAAALRALRFRSSL